MLQRHLNFGCGVPWTKFTHIVPIIHERYYIGAKTLVLKNQPQHCPCFDVVGGKRRVLYNVAVTAKKSGVERLTVL
jgi:hypothetical protein